MKGVRLFGSPTTFGAWATGGERGWRERGGARGTNSASIALPSGLPRHHQGPVPHDGATRRKSVACALVFRQSGEMEARWTPREEEWAHLGRPRDDGTCYRDQCPVSFELMRSIYSTVPVNLQSRDSSRHRARGWLGIAQRGRDFLTSASLYLAGLSSQVRV